MIDGSVIFWRGGLLVYPISKQTGSSLTHVAIVLDDWVFEAIPPHVRKMRLLDYYAHLEEWGQHKFIEQRNFSWFMIKPRKEFSVPALAVMKIYAQSQLGRRYMLRGWWQQQETRGIFCSQYIGNIIAQSGLISSASYHESPGSLYKKLLPFYQ
jgi:hypothetical protein